MVLQIRKLIIRICSSLYWVEMGLEVTGLAEMNKRLLNLIRALPGEVERAIVSEANQVLELAKYRTPVDTGELKSSGVMNTLSAWGSHETSVQLSFGTFGASQDYAIYVHENLEAEHTPPTRSKFLESAILDSSTGMEGRLRDRIKLERLLGA